MKPSQLAVTIRAAINMRKPAFVWGAAGIGKSSIFAQVALAIRAENIRAEVPAISDDHFQRLMSAPMDDGEFFGLIDIRTLYFDTVDFTGIPYNDNGVTAYCAPPMFPRDAKWRGIILLDEFNSAPPQVQAIGYQLFNNRRINAYTVPEGAFLFGAGNRANDRGVVHRTPDPVLDRWFNVYLEHDVNEWTQWALANGVRPEVVAFIRFRPALLHVHDTKRECHAFATPRGYEDVSKLLAQNLPPEIEAELVKGRIGDAQASEFMAFLKLYRNMVSPDQVLLNPTGADVPSNSGILYALSEALARRATPKNIDAVLTYAARMPPEYQQALMSSATRLTPALCNTAEFIGWASKRAA